MDNKFYKGRIAAANEVDGNWIYSIAYDDGDWEEGVPERFIHFIEDPEEESFMYTSRGVAVQPSYDNGDRVEIFLHTEEQGSWHKGTLHAMTEDCGIDSRNHLGEPTGARGFYRVVLDEYESKQGLVDHVVVERLRPIAKDPLEHAEGDIVTANWYGFGRYYCAQVETVGADHTYSIRYFDDDSLETQVPLDRVQAVYVNEFQVGERVEANWQNLGDWYPGEIATARCNQYTITYDDGDKEMHVPSDRIRKEPACDMLYNPGDVVEANFAGYGEWYTATIADAEHNSTGVRGCFYHVIYHSGEEEGHVPYRSVRAHEDIFPIGAEVESDWYYWGIYYKGRITDYATSSRSNYYKVQYSVDNQYPSVYTADSEIEDEVPAHHIRYYGCPDICPEGTTVVCQAPDSVGEIPGTDDKTECRDDMSYDDNTKICYGGQAAILDELDNHGECLECEESVCVKCSEGYKHEGHLGCVARQDHEQGVELCGEGDDPREKHCL